MENARNGNGQEKQETDGARQAREQEQKDLERLTTWLNEDHDNHIKHHLMLANGIAYCKDAIKGVNTKVNAFGFFLFLAIVAAAVGGWYVYSKVDNASKLANTALNATRTLDQQLLGTVGGDGKRVDNGIMAKKSDLDGFVTKDALNGYATTEALKGYATTEALKGYATTEALNGYATTEALNGYAKADALNGYAKADDVTGIQTWVNERKQERERQEALQKEKEKKQEEARKAAAETDNKKVRKEAGEIIQLNPGFEYAGKKLADLIIEPLLHDGDTKFESAIHAERKRLTDLATASLPAPAPAPTAAPVAQAQPPATTVVDPALAQQVQDLSKTVGSLSENVNGLNETVQGIGKATKNLSKPRYIPLVGGALARAQARGNLENVDLK